MLLNIDNITVSYGGVRAGGVSCQVEEGEIMALIGANGAGKSTTLKAICGLVRPPVGTITFDNKVLNKMPPHKIDKPGNSQVPETRGFTRLTVLENLEMGGYTRKKAGEVKDS